MNDPTSVPMPSSSQESSSAPRDEAALALKTTVNSDIHELADKAKDVAGGVVDHARQSVESQITGGKDRVAEGLGSVAEAMRHTGEHLRSQDKLGLTEYVARAADQIDAASDYLQDRKLGEVVTDLSRFARREPALFLGSAFALGLIGGRFLKSSHVTPAPQAIARGGGSNASTNRARSPQQPPKRHPTASPQSLNYDQSAAPTLPGGRQLASDEDHTKSERSSAAPKPRTGVA